MHSPGFISTVDTAVPLAAEEIQLILSFPRPQKPLWDAEEGKLSPYRWDREDRTQPGARQAFTRGTRPAWMCWILTPNAPFWAA